MMRRCEAETRAVGTSWADSSASSQAAPGMSGRSRPMRSSKPSLRSTLSSARVMSAPVASMRKPALRVMGPPTTT